MIFQSNFQSAPSLSGKWFLLLRYYFMIGSLQDFKTIKFIFRDFIYLYCVGTFLVVGSVLISFQELLAKNAANGFYTFYTLTKFVF